MTEMQPDKRKGRGVLKWILIGCGSLSLIAVILIVVGIIFVNRAIPVCNDTIHYACDCHVFASSPGTAEAVATKILPMNVPKGFAGVRYRSLGKIKKAVLGPRH